MQVGLPLEKEKVRATLVIGLIASVIALRLYVPEATTPKVSLIFGVLLIYWFLYAFLTAYAISGTEGSKLANGLLWLGDLSFRFALYVLGAGIATLIILETSGWIVVVEWNYLTVWFATMIGYSAPEITHLLRRLSSWKQFSDYFRSHLKEWALTWIMSLPLLVVHFYRMIL